MNFIFWKVMIDIGFWTRLHQKKIQQYRLDSSSRYLSAKYRLSNKPDKLSIVSIDAYSYGDTQQGHKSGPVEVKIAGNFINTNTLEEFKQINIEDQENKLIQLQCQKMNRIINGQQINMITQFKLLIFGDLKRHAYLYHFLACTPIIENYQTISIESAKIALQNHIQQLNQYVNYYINQDKQVPQFVVLKDYKISTLKQFISNPQSSDYLFCITDSTNYPKSTGYQTNNVLWLLNKLKVQNLIPINVFKKIKILLMKQYLIYTSKHKYTFQNSQLWIVDLSHSQIKLDTQKLSHPMKLVEIDLKSFMDDNTLAKQAVDLNIKLMKWRLMPSLNIQKIQRKKCLLFGAGTLGCQLARNLIGWGIKNITFIDYSKVNFSNPVRQSLYDYEDAIKGGKPKAQTAAKKLKKIYPQIHSQGYNLQIPMPGHYVTKQQHIKQTFQSINLLQKLVSQHDVLFLLLDSRQARWLPTVLANKFDKACITVGLGFDSFVIVRHGVPPQLFKQQIHKQRICCYFCNDIITPQNTMKDRTLDQMCTVTRPGLSFVASAYASQLYISLIHHPMEHHACANQNPQKLQTTDLGKLPHHLRGSMSDFQTNIFYGKAFQQCVACSKYILDQYNQNRDQFMMRVMNDPSFIHKVVKLQDQIREFQKMQYNIIQIGDDDDTQYIISSKQNNKQINQNTENK